MKCTCHKTGFCFVAEEHCPYFDYGETKEPICKLNNAIGYTSKGSINKT